jgi:hypothetical protein
LLHIETATAKRSSFSYGFSIASCKRDVYSSMCLLLAGVQQPRVVAVLQCHEQCVQHPHLLHGTHNQVAGLGCHKLRQRCNCCAALCSTKQQVAEGIVSIYAPFCTLASR